MLRDAFGTKSSFSPYAAHQANHAFLSHHRQVAARDDAHVVLGDIDRHAGMLNEQVLHGTGLGCGSFCSETGGRGDKPTLIHASLWAWPTTTPTASTLTPRARGNGWAREGCRQSGPSWQGHGCGGTRNWRARTTMGSGNCCIPCLTFMCPTSLAKWVLGGRWTFNHWEQVFFMWLITVWKGLYRKWGFELVFNLRHADNFYWIHGSDETGDEKDQEQQGWKRCYKNVNMAIV